MPTVVRIQNLNYRRQTDRQTDFFNVINHHVSNVWSVLRVLGWSSRSGWTSGFISTTFYVCTSDHIKPTSDEHTVFRQDATSIRRPEGRRQTKETKENLGKKTGYYISIEMNKLNMLVRLQIWLRTQAEPIASLDAHNRPLLPKLAFSTTSQVVRITCPNPVCTIPDRNLPFC